MTDQEKEIARKIGQFYLQKNNGDYSKAEAEINAMNITSIKIEKRMGLVSTVRNILPSP